MKKSLKRAAFIGVSYMLALVPLAVKAYAANNNVIYSPGIINEGEVTITNTDDESVIICEFVVGGDCHGEN